MLFFYSPSTTEWEEAASEGDRIKTRMSAGSSTFQIRSADGAAALLLCLAGSSKYNGREQRNLKVIYFLTGLDGLVNSNHPGQKVSRRRMAEHLVGGMGGARKVAPKWCL